MPIAPDAAHPIAALHGQASALTIDAYAAIASQYVYRGIALRDRPTPTFSVTTNTARGWFADVWAGLVDAHTQDDYENSHGTAWNIDTSIGYGASFGADWQWSFAGARILDVGGPLRNYTEWRANVFFRDAARAEFVYSDDYLQRGASSWNAEISGFGSLPGTLRGEWGIGHVHGTGGTGDDYDYGWIGLSGLWLHTQWDVRWVDTTGIARHDLYWGSPGSRVVLTLSWGLRVLP